VQVHFRGMLDYDLQHDSHKSYEYFRKYFGGNMETVRDQMSTLKMIFDQKSETLDGTVQKILETGCKPELEGVYNLLTAKVAEYKLALKVAERILELETAEHTSDPSKEKYDQKLDAMEKKADMMYKIGTYRECLPIYVSILDGKKSICGDNTLMLVRAMANLGNCHRVLGDYDSCQPMLGRYSTEVSRSSVL